MLETIYQAVTKIPKMQINNLFRKYNGRLLEMPLLFSYVITLLDVRQNTKLKIGV